MSDYTMQVKATINGEEKQFLCEPRQSLLEVLRDLLFLTGTKEGCNDGNCGACTVMIDNVSVNSCCVLAVETEGRQIETVEGLAVNNELHPLQQAFLEESALQCGYCTPGLLMSAKDLIDSNPRPSTEEVRYWMANNLCRCTGYDRIVKAVERAANVNAKQP